ncbi:MAG: hypothetical protein ACK41C_01205 [Phenylobacterium sp.]|uniref:hypothetical protein n=1 Tax=Phenylobacterium sp. TaxID=1871053 RepID=UPI00391D6A43
MLSQLLWRAALVATPFVIWFIWREIARRTGREMGATPWAWLIAAGAILMGVSLLASTAFRQDNRGQTYVPAEVQPDGRVAPGRFETK